MVRGLSDAPSPVQQCCEALQAEVYSLRLDLAEAEALIEALEAELWRISTRWGGGDDERSAFAAMDLLIRARTLLRRALSPWLESDDTRRAKVLWDLRIAEVSFAFLLRLPSVRRATQVCN